MYEKLKRLYEEERIGIDELVKAVKMKMITEDQFFQITGQRYIEIIRQMEREAEENE